MAAGPYTINVRFINGKGLPPADAAGFPPKVSSDPFVRAYIEGKKEKSVYSTVEQKNLNPDWPEATNKKAVEGVSFADDVLCFDVHDLSGSQFDSDGISPGKKCRKIASTTLKLSDLAFGGMHTQTLKLRTDVDLKAIKASAAIGTLTVLVNPVPIGHPAFTEWKEGEPAPESETPAPEPEPVAPEPVAEEKPAPVEEKKKASGYTAKVKFVSAKGVPAADKILWGLGKPRSDPYIKAKVKSIGDSSTKKTSVRENTCDPEWGEERTFKLKTLDDSLIIVIWDHDSKGGDDKLCSCEIPLTGFEIGTQQEINDIELTPLFKGAKEGGVLNLMIIVTEGDEEAQFCTFDWGSNNPSYSTSFAECDTEHGYKGLGPEEEDEKKPEGYHKHEITKSSPVEHVDQKFSGKITEAKIPGLPKFGLVIYGLRHGELKDKSKPKKEGDADIIDAESFGEVEFSFDPVGPGEWFGVLVVDENQKQYALGKTKIKKLEAGDSTTTITLAKAPKFEGEAPEGGFGSLTLVANLTPK